MRIHHVYKSRRGPGAPKRSEDGSAVILFIALLAIMVILANGDNRALYNLHRDIKALEQQQIKRLDASQTNAVVMVKSDSR